MRYEKGRKDETRGKIIKVASEHFRGNGVAASGLAAIMKDAGLTNGAFYPHFSSKADLVGACIAAALKQQQIGFQDILASGGLDAAIAAYLSPEHRDNPEHGCASAALLPEIAREPVETRDIYTERLMATVQDLSAEIPAAKNAENVVLVLLATVIGALQMSRAVSDKELSDRILLAGAEAARQFLAVAK